MTAEIEVQIELDMPEMSDGRSTLFSQRREFTRSSRPAGAVPAGDGRVEHERAADLAGVRLARSGRFASRATVPSGGG